MALALRGFFDDDLFNPFSFAGFPFDIDLDWGTRGAGRRGGGQGKGAQGERGQRRMATGVDIIEYPDRYEFLMDVPGVKKENMKVQVLEGRVLNISGERQPPQLQENATVQRSERGMGQFERSFRLPQNADPSKVSAKIEDGVLVVSVGKKEEGEQQRQAQDVQIS
eukprot:jgi/Chlat1/7620/Chrsp64S09156